MAVHEAGRLIRQEVTLSLPGAGDTKVMDLREQQITYLTH